MASAISSYRLETPRPKPPPIPIRSSNTLSSSSQHRDTSAPLLYDLPSATPASPRSPCFSPPPTSPTGRSQSRMSRSKGMTPPPHNRTLTAAQPQERDLENFASVCKSWYFDQDDKAGRIMTQTLATLPSSHRAPFARLQASIRSAYHASVNARRNAEFQAHLSATVPGASLMPASRADPSGPLARKERLERFERFIRAWCVQGMPGTKPFFTGLWSVMRLSVLPENLGGAGGNRIEWEIDDAVFKEAAGKDFMLEAIDVLKGYLGFEEAPSLKQSTSSVAVPYSPFTALTPIHSRSQSTPLPSASSATSRSTKAPPIASTTQTKRARAPSDPFVDSHLPTPNTLSASYSSANTIGQLSSSGSSTDEQSLPPTPRVEATDPFRNYANVLDLSETETYMRIWTAPDLSNAELLALLNVFPSFVVQNPLPRFPSVELRVRRDIEEGADSDGDSGAITVGTGTMWVGGRSRSPGWKGNWWSRFRQWLRRLFC
ncbi:hypothetical protein BDY19DRAFT_921611 [Irpex rosettiformis]|uniref:Uncharacterized protein n=1 Tax=Irpex rosettiformis TaxID=378272 RepID=A0ACB8UG60_9APHY|nr:hypothetical protein BDY19DRAFT_921611 [Irpex rosettiformis]